MLFATYSVVSLSVAVRQALHEHVSKSIMTNKRTAAHLQVCSGTVRIFKRAPMLQTVRYSVLVVVYCVCFSDCERSWQHDSHDVMQCLCGPVVAQCADWATV